MEVAHRALWEASLPLAEKCAVDFITKAHPTRWCACHRTFSSYKPLSRPRRIKGSTPSSLDERMERKDDDDGLGDDDDDDGDDDSDDRIVTIPR